EQHERVVEEVLGGVARSPVGSARHVDTEHMVRCAEAVVAEAFGGLGEVAHDDRVALNVDQRQTDSELHGMTSWWRSRSHTTTWPASARACSAAIRLQRFLRAVRCGRKTL